MSKQIQRVEQMSQLHNSHNGSQLLLFNVGESSDSSILQKSWKQQGQHFAWVAQAQLESKEEAPAPRWGHVPGQSSPAGPSATRDVLRARRPIWCHQLRSVLGMRLMKLRN